MYLIHEHCNSTSAIDKYWIFNREQDAKVFYKKKVDNFYKYIDKRVYQELYDLNEDPDTKTFDTFFEEQINEFDCLYLTGGDYIVFSKLEKDENNTLHGRRS